MLTNGYPQTRTPHPTPKLQALNASLLRDIEVLRKEEDHAEKQLHDVARDLDIAQQNLVRVSSTTQKQVQLVRTAEQTKSNLEHEIAAYKEEASKMRKVRDVVSALPSLFVSSRTPPLTASPVPLRHASPPHTHPQTAHLFPGEGPGPPHIRGPPGGAGVRQAGQRGQALRDGRL